MRSAESARANAALDSPNGSRRKQRCGEHAMIEDMSTVRIAETELPRDVHAVMEKVQQGIEVIVEQDHRPVAVIRAPNRQAVKSLK